MATLPAGEAGNAASNFARIRNFASLTCVGVTRIVHAPDAGLSTKASASNWLLVAADAAVVPLGSIMSTVNVSLRCGVSTATRRRAPPAATRTGHSTGGLEFSTCAPPGQKLAWPTASEKPDSARADDPGNTARMTR